MESHVFIDLSSRRLRYDTLNATQNTYLGQAKLMERTTALRRRVYAFSEAQALHMPITGVLREQLGSERSSNAHQAIYDYPLLLPSAVILMGSTCDPVLLDFEWRARYAAAHDSLEQMRKHLLSRTTVLDWKGCLKFFVFGRGLLALSRHLLRGGQVYYL